jgi:D-3-phosphoglycerate dehydrogenase
VSDARDRRVLIPTHVPAEVLQVFREYPDLSVDAPGELNGNALAAKLADFDAVIIRSNNTITAAMIESSARLRVIGRAGTGLDNVDVAAATRRGVVVMNTPGVNAISTAEHTISMLMSLARRIPAADRSVKEGRWERARFQGVEVTGKLLGVVGLGRIGVQVARRALGLGLRVVAHDPFVNAETFQNEDVRLVELDELFRTSDFSTVHTPLVDGTQHLLNREAFARMRDGVRIVNCARGGIVDEEALCDAVDSGKVAGAALDVYEDEPPQGRRVTLYDNILTTPHLGGSTREAQLNVGLAIARQVADFLTRGIIQNAANAAPVTGQTRARVGPFLEVGERIGSIAAQLLDGVMRRVGVTVYGERCKTDTRMLATSVLKGALSVSLEEYGVNLVNADTLAQQRGIDVEVAEGAERDDFANLIRVRVESDRDAHEICGTQFGKRDSRVVNLDGYPVEMSPHGAMIFTLSENRPGIIGRLGTLVAKYGRNIEKMNNGCSPDGQRALSTLNVDQPPDPRLVEELRREPGFEWVRLVLL